MKLSCDIVKDILPLYAEDMVSNATKDVVEEHICDCADCSKELESLKQAQKLPVEADVKSLKRVGDAIRRRRVLSVMAVFLLVATVLIGSAFVLDVTVMPINGQTIHSDLLYYMGGIATVSILCFFAGRYFRAKWYGELLLRFAIVSGSLAVAMIVVATTMPYSILKEAIVDSTVVALPMCLFGLCVRQLIKLNRQDKGK